MSSKIPLELTLAILKPHVVKNPIVLQKIYEMITENGLKVVRSQRKIITLPEADLFYQEHRQKFFYNRLVTFMSSGPSDILILAGENAVLKWREIMGPTKVFQAQYSAPDTIRGKFGLSDTRNATHGSDSTESAEREMQILFKDFDSKKWRETDRSLRDLGQKMKLDAESFKNNIDESSVDREQNVK
ncbi:nucleoside diphosphate kinase 6 [Diachasma alloeum]|uniref:nucleoside diphosphate kinase 6 n=1 Tax=Diachasma alloeum TaxID=454923 RepID=UPI0007383516|nr:nucleoside diphosphate kinase 6 [Diachasma alloeum]